MKTARIYRQNEKGDDSQRPLGGKSRAANKQREGERMIAFPGVYDLRRCRAGEEMKLHELVYL